MNAFGADIAREWIETDALGGFASGTVSTIRTRRYHALLLSAQTPPSDRWVLVNDVEVWLDVDGQRLDLSSHQYGDVIHPNGAERIRSFSIEPWPTWTYAVAGFEVEFEVCGVHESPTTLLRWTPRRLDRPATLFVRPLLSGRDPHQLQRQNGAFLFGLSVDDGRLSWSSYPDVPQVHALANGRYTHAPQWYRNFTYAEEAARGLDHIEDLASPGVFAFPLGEGAADLVFSGDRAALGGASDGATAVGNRWRALESDRRAGAEDALSRAAKQYVVRRGDNHTVIAGYPWFGDWGRDTFIALRGLRHLADGTSLVQSILQEWSAVVSKGMLPNRFPDRGDEPEYNSVDASLWYVLAVRELLTTDVSTEVRAQLLAAVAEILDGYTVGTRYGIRADDNGLLSAGVQGVQLTWMDAKVGDWVVTPRIGKPVEIQALWLNALDFARTAFQRFEEPFRRGRSAFSPAFYDPALGHLYDVVDVDHEPGRNDRRLRPNQVLALGGLPLSLVDRPLARSILSRIEQTLWTPMGPRSLACHEPCYAATYDGGVRARDGAYHQGTVWPWLTGPFVDAWVWAHGGDASVQREARRRFLVPLFGHLEEAGLGHVSEIADGAAPHRPRGAPFQAWSVTELLRLDRTLAH